MSYATTNYYQYDYAGKPISDETLLQRLLDRASDDLDFLTMGRIDITAMSDADLDTLYKANCAQAEFYSNNGMAEAGGSASLGSFSYSGDSTGSVAYSSRAVNYLAMLGFSRAAATIGDKRGVCE